MRRLASRNLKGMILLAAMLGATSTTWGKGTHDTTVGKAVQIEDLVLPAPQLEPVPLDAPDAPLVLRIVGVAPHGNSFRYHLEYYALEPGQYNLMEYLQPTESQEPQALEPFLVKVDPLHPVGQQVHPHQPELGEVPSVGGYRMWMVVGAITWFAIAVAIVMVGRKRAVKTEVRDETPLSLADRLRPAVESAMAGTMSESELAEFERMLVAFWRRRLGLEEVPAVEAIRRMRAHPEGGQLLRQLEQWLHQPGQRQQVDVTELLAPYRNLPPDALPVASQEVVHA